MFGKKTDSQAAQPVNGPAKAAPAPAKAAPPKADAKAVPAFKPKKPSDGAGLGLGGKAVVFAAILLIATIALELLSLKTLFFF